MNKPTKKKESAPIAVGTGSGGAFSATREDSPTKSRRKSYRRPRLSEAVESLRQLNLECEVAKLEALGKAASL